ILGIVVAQLAAADAPHPRAVSVDEGGNSRLVAPIDVTTEQLAVAKPVTHHPANVLDHARRHAPPSTSYLPHKAELIHDFPRRTPAPAPERLHIRVSRRKQTCEAGPRTPVPDPRRRVRFSSGRLRAVPLFVARTQFRTPPSTRNACERDGTG